MLAAGWESAPGCPALQVCAASFRSSEPCGELAAVVHPSPAGIELLLQGQQGDWQTGWQAARLLWLTSTTPDSEQYTQLPDPCPALAGAK